MKAPVGWYILVLTQNSITGPSGSSNNALSNFPLAPEAKYEVFHDLLNDLLRPSSHMSTVMYDISTAAVLARGGDFDDQVGWQTSELQCTFGRALARRPGAHIARQGHASKQGGVHRRDSSSYLVPVINNPKNEVMNWGQEIQETMLGTLLNLFWAWLDGCRVLLAGRPADKSLFSSGGNILLAFFLSSPITWLV